jgi:hypothetical protein
VTKSVRITVYMRDRIVNDMLKHRFGPEVEALIDARAAFAEAVYRDVYDDVTRAKMAKLPQGWLPERSSIGAQFGGGSRYDVIDFNGHGLGSSAQLAEKRDAILRRHIYRHQHGPWKAYEPTDALAIRHAELDAARRDLETRISDAERKAKAAVDGASTTGRLVEMWPEAAPFVAAVAPSPVKLPAIPVDALNEMFRLPVEEAA